MAVLEDYKSESICDTRTGRGISEVRRYRACSIIEEALPPVEVLISVNKRYNDKEKNIERCGKNRLKIAVTTILYKKIYKSNT